MNTSIYLSDKRFQLCYSYVYIKYNAALIQLVKIPQNQNASLFSHQCIWLLLKYNKINNLKSRKCGSHLEISPHSMDASEKVTGFIYSAFNAKDSIWVYKSCPSTMVSGSFWADSGVQSKFLLAWKIIAPLTSMGFRSSHLWPRDQPHKVLHALNFHWNQ